MHLSPSVALAAVRSKAVVLLLIRCWLFPPLWDSGIVLCFVVLYFVSILVLQSSWWGRESWLLCFVCPPGVLWLLCGSSSRYHRFVCGLWLWYFLIILTYYFCIMIVHTLKMCTYFCAHWLLECWMKTLLCLHHLWDAYIVLSACNLLLQQFSFTFIPVYFQYELKLFKPWSDCSREQSYLGTYSVCK